MGGVLAPEPHARVQHRLRPALEVLEWHFQIIEQRQQTTRWLPALSLEIISGLVANITAYPHTFAMESYDLDFKDRG